MVDEIHFSSKSAEWETPKTFFEFMDFVFGPFQLDPAATKENAKAPRFFTKEDDGLAQEWKADAVWLNPPYGRGKVGERWVAKAVEEVRIGHAGSVVLLLPARTDTIWFHKYVFPRCIRIGKVYAVPEGIETGGRTVYYAVRSSDHDPEIRDGVVAFVLFVAGRLRFEGEGGDNGAPFPSLVVAFARELPHEEGGHRADQEGAGAGGPGGPGDGAGIPGDATDEGGVGAGGSDPHP